MCGFAGIISNNTVKYDNICKMNDLLIHRGPDSTNIIGLNLADGKFIEVGSYCTHELNCISSFRRLSIRDLSINGNQPMLGNHTLISYVGELYNSDEMKEILENKGEIFKSKSDTEVILKWYENFGVKSLVNTLSGIYAIVIIDKFNKVAYLIRDRFGVKPLYYFFKNKILIYSSEIKSICESGYYNAEINYDDLGEILLYRSPRLATLFKGINQVSPGEMLSYDLNTGVLSKKVWFNIDKYVRMKQTDISEAEAYTLLNDKLSDAIERQLVSDVAIGIQLSGGIDSGIIANMARRHRPLKSYSIIGGKGYYSEEDRIKRINRDNIDLMRLFDFSICDFLKEYEKVIWHLDGINSHPNALGFFKLTQNARKDVSILMSGEGADELLAGYRQFVVIKAFCGPCDSYAIIADQDVDMMLMKTLFPDIEFDACINQRNEIWSGFNGDSIDKHIKYELATYLPDLLIKQDRMSMANSIENRVPFLDYNLVDTIMTLPNEYLVKYAYETNRYEGKYLLKRLASDIYDEDYGFQKKKGFPMPILEWLTQNEFKNYVFETLISGMKKRNIINTKFFEIQYNKITELKEKEIKVLWKIINLESWAQIFLDNRKVIDLQPSMI